MRLYHFTGREHLPGIERDGLMPQRHPWIKSSGWVWLTSDPTWAQPWQRAEFECDRTAVRIEVALPRDHALPWKAVRGLVLPEYLADLEGCGGSASWWVAPRVRRGLIRAIVYRETAA